MTADHSRLEARFETWLQKEIESTRAALRSLSRVVDHMEERVDYWAAPTSPEEMGCLFVLETLQDLGRLK